MISASVPAAKAGWMAKGLLLLKTLGPYAIVELVLPGGTLIALLLWLYMHRQQQAPAPRAAGQSVIRGAGRLAFAWRRALVLSVAAALTTACTVGPEFVKPAAPASAYSHSVPAPGGTQGFAYGAEVAGDWYQLFHSDALDDLVRQALANNPDLEGARHGLAAAQDELRAVSGTALPQIDATGQIGRAHINGSELYGPVNAIDVTGNRYEIGPSLAYNLDPFGGVRRSIESQEAQTAAVRDQLRDTYVTLVDQVVVTAFDYAAVRAQIKVTRSLVSELQAQYELNRRKKSAARRIISRDR